MDALDLLGSFRAARCRAAAVMGVLTAGLLLACLESSPNSPDNLPPRDSLYVNIPVATYALTRVDVTDWPWRCDTVEGQEYCGYYRGPTQYARMFTLQLDSLSLPRTILDTTTFKGFSPWGEIPYCKITVDGTLSASGEGAIPGATVPARADSGSVVVKGVWRENIPLQRLWHEDSALYNRAFHHGDPVPDSMLFSRAYVRELLAGNCETWFGPDSVQMGAEPETRQPICKNDSTKARFLLLTDYVLNPDYLIVRVDTTDLPGGEHKTLNASIRVACPKP
jgi:hypothetical protein